MELIYINSVDDFVDGILLVLKRNYSLIFQEYVFPRVVYPIGCFLVIGHYFIKGDYLNTIVLFFTWLSMQVILYKMPKKRKRFYRKFKRICYKKPYLLMEKKLSITNDIMKFSCDDYEMNLSVNTVKHILIFNEKLFLYKKHYKIACVIPVEALETNHVFDEFLKKFNLDAEYIK